MKPKFTQEFLNSLITENGKHTIGDGIFKGFVVNPNDEGPAIITCEDKNGNPLFSVTISDRNIDEQLLLDFFVCHLAKSCAHSIVNTAQTKKSMKEGGENLSFKQEYLPQCLTQMPKAFFTYIIPVPPQANPYENADSEKKLFDFQVSVKDLLIDLIGFEVSEEAKLLKTQFKDVPKQLEQEFNTNLQNSYAEACMLISEEVFNDNFEKALERTEKAEHILDTGL